MDLWRLNPTRPRDCICSCENTISESVTPDPEVANHDSITIEYSYHNGLSHSVQNDTQEPELPLENQQSQIINQNNISKSASKSRHPTLILHWILRLINQERKATQNPDLTGRNGNA